MITNEVLRERARIIRKRGRESHRDSRFYQKTGRKILAAQYRGRYQAYCDAYHLVNTLMNTTKKGGD